MFLDEVASGKTDLVTIAHKSYTESLKPYHSFIVRGLFLVSSSILLVSILISQYILSQYTHKSVYS